MFSPFPALLGVKSRLAIKNLPDEYKRIIDKYFADVFVKIQKKRREESKPEYERLYDGERGELSFADADSIEMASWVSTERLIDQAELDEDDDKNTFTKELSSDQVVGIDVCCNSTECMNSMLGDVDIKYLHALIEGKRDEMNAVVSSSGELEEGIVDRINEAFSEYYGDIAIDISSGSAELIEDYREDIFEWIKK